MTHNVWIDCDPGLDDFLALIGAINSPELNIAGFSSVSGNVSGGMTAKNLAEILSFCACAIPFAQGASKPLKREFVDASHVHGKSGMGSLVLPPSGLKALDGPAHAHINQALEQFSGQLSLVSLGPLTNIAELLLEHPESGALIKRIVMMGGAHEKGNITPSAEFNIYADPEAAKIVFHSGVPVLMIGLNATEEAFFTVDEIERYFVKGKSGRMDAIRTCLLNLCGANERLRGKKIACVHDLLAVLAVFDESLVELKSCAIDVETGDREQYGKTICNFDARENAPAAKIALHCRREAFIREALKRLY